MKKLITLMLVVGLLWSCQNDNKETKAEDSANKETTVAEQTIKDEKAYALGYRIASDLKNTGIELDLDTMKKAMDDAANGTPALDEEAMAKAFQAFQMAAQQNQMAKQTEAAEANVEIAKAFLAENATKDGVKTTESGLQYEVMTMGKGKKPAETDKVRVHYAGTLVDGTEFDSSIKRNSPAEFPLNGVIAGWTEGLQLMPVGSKFKFYISPELGYGPRGAGKIPPNSALIFEVELLDILK